MEKLPYLAFMIFFLAALALRMKRELSFVRIGSLRFLIRLIVLPIVALLVSVFVVGESLSLLVMTWALSLSLVVYSLKTTEFEKRTDGTWFRKNQWVSIAVLLLFVGRLVYRSWVYMSLVEAAPQTRDQLAEFWVRTPLSLVTLLLLTSYNALYYLAVYRSGAQKRL